MNVSSDYSICENSYARGGQQTTWLRPAERRETATVARAIPGRGPRRAPGLSRNYEIIATWPWGVSLKVDSAGKMQSPPVVRFEIGTQVVPLSWIERLLLIFFTVVIFFKLRFFIVVSVSGKWIWIEVSLIYKFLNYFIVSLHVISCNIYLIYIDNSQKKVHHKINFNFLQVVYFDYTNLETKKNHKSN